MLVGARTPEMRKQFRAQILTGDPRVIWEDVVKTYDTAAQKSWTTLNRELIDRFLKQGESVDLYTQDMML